MGKEIEIKFLSNKALKNALKGVFFVKITLVLTLGVIMAVIHCPACSKKISDKSPACNYCGLALNELDKDKLATIEKENKIRKQQSLMNHSFIAMLLFCGGFLFLFWQNAQPGSWQYITAMTATFIGFILYLVTRVRIILLKRKLK
ncbi:hypothetical protein [Colwellia sp. MEBiC06753]